MIELTLQTISHIGFGVWVIVAAYLLIILVGNIIFIVALTLIEALLKLKDLTTTYLKRNV